LTLRAVCGRVERPSGRARCHSGGRGSCRASSLGSAGASPSRPEPRPPHRYAPPPTALGLSPAGGLGMTTYVTAEGQLDPPARGADPLEVFFAPESVAVFGATEAIGSVGRAVLANLIRHPFGATLFPISPGRSGVLGVKAYPSLADAPAAA